MLDRISSVQTFIDLLGYIGGNVWESNPPKKLLTPHTGFEDQREHQNPSTPETKQSYHSFEPESITNRKEKERNSLLMNTSLFVKITKLLDKEWTCLFLSFGLFIKKFTDFLI